MKKFVGYYHYGVILTYLSIAAAIVGICLSVVGYPFWGGVICLIISGNCDAFDGAVARTRKNRTIEDKMFGSKIDSLSDVIAFGVAPVMIGYGMGMREWYYIVVFVLYVLCAVCRLAYFDIEEDLRMQRGDTGRREFCYGLPVTSSAAAVPVTYLVAVMFRNLEGLVQSLVPKLLMCACYVLIGFLMVFKFKMIKPRTKWVFVIVISFGLLCLALTLINIFVIDGSVNYVIP